MQVGIYFDQTRCTGCCACQVACKDWHDIDAGPEKWMRVLYQEKGIFPQVFVSYMIGTCFHCDDPICAAACPAGAITKRDADGIVIVDSTACLGKEKCDVKCLKACPYDAPQFGPENGAKMRKCNFCLDRYLDGKKPSCVETCYVRALDFGTLEELERKYGSNKTAENFTYSKRTRPSIVLKSKSYTGR